MRHLLILLTAATTLSSCLLFGGKKINGNGNIITEKLSVGSFHSIDVSGAATVRLRQDATSAVSIQTDENLLEYLDVSVDGNTLVIKTKRNVNLRPTKEVIVYASAAAFREIEASGACTIISENVISGNEALEISASGATSFTMQVALPRLTTDVSGSGKVKLRGTARVFAGSISGAGSIKAFDLVTDDTELDLSGAADAEITADKTLDVEVSGSGDVQYRGNAAVNQRISGAGSVKKVS